MLQILDKVPAFNLQDENGNWISNKSLLGQKYILFFYPKDDSPGCTKECCSIRDNYKKIKKSEYQIFGVSPDKPAKHRKFIDKFEFQYSLLADTEKELINAFKVWGPKKFMGKIIIGVYRSTFIINEEGIIVDVIDKVKTKIHGEQILEALETIKAAEAIQ